jgi:hypothetical protein
MATQRIKAGQLVEIDLGSERRAFGRVISKSELAFYDFCMSADTPLDLNAVYSSSVAFLLSVANSAVKSGRWKVIDCTPVEPMFEAERFYVMRDALTGEVSIYNAMSGEILPAQSGDDIGLERAAVWDAEHVEDRLRDHFAGTRNQWVEQLK